MSQIASGIVTEVLPGVWQLPIPLPGHGIGRVNSYVLEHDGRLLMIDTGYAVPEGRAAMLSMFRAMGRRIEDIEFILTTHLHADHCGLAGWLQSETGAPVAMHGADADRLRDRYVEQAAVREATARWLEEVGAPERSQEMAMRQIARWREQFDGVEPDRRLVGGEHIDHGRFHLEVIHTPGHTPGHVCFYERTTRAMFTGDTILPRITYSPTYRPFPSSDPISEYRSSLARLAGYPMERGLPGHQDPFIGVVQRIEQLDEHHEQRSRRILRSLQGGARTAWEVASSLKRKRPWNDVRAAGQLSAVGEVYAHLIALRRAGAAHCSDDIPLRWMAAEASSHDHRLL